VFLKSGCLVPLQEAERKSFIRGEAAWHASRLSACKLPSRLIGVLGKMIYEVQNIALLDVYIPMIDVLPEMSARY
jgi:hypothetical protein